MLRDIGKKQALGRSPAALLGRADVGKRIAISDGNVQVVEDGPYQTVSWKDVGPSVLFLLTYLVACRWRTPEEQCRI